MTLDEALAEIRAKAEGDPKRFGTAFENLIANLLRSYALWQPSVRKVWRWAEFPAREALTARGLDAGIDLVVETYRGTFWAVQCKCYAPGHQVSKADLDSFLALSSKTFPWKSAALDQPEKAETPPRQDGSCQQGKTVRFDRRLLFISNNSWSDQAEDAIRHQEPPVQKYDHFTLSGYTIDWDNLLHGQPLVRKTFDPKPHQQRALNDAHKHFADHDRGMMVMACGTGKTLTGLRLLEQELPEGGLALFLVPSIALLNQTLISWTEQARLNFRAICICSDPSASTKKTRTPPVMRRWNIWKSLRPLRAPIRKSLPNASVRPAKAIPRA